MEKFQELEAPRNWKTHYSGAWHAVRLAAEIKNEVMKTDQAESKNVNNNMYNNETAEWAIKNCRIQTRGRDAYQSLLSYMGRFQRTAEPLEKERETIQKQLMKVCHLLETAKSDK